MCYNYPALNKYFIIIVKNVLKYGNLILFYSNKSAKMIIRKFEEKKV
jgi:hypothetical protein